MRLNKSSSDCLANYYSGINILYLLEKSLFPNLYLTVKRKSHFLYKCLYSRMKLRTFQQNIKNSRFN